MLQITLSQRAHDSPLSDMTKRELLAAATESWVLNPVRVARERYAVVIALDAYVLALEILDVVLTEALGGSTSGRRGRYNIVGQRLLRGHPVYDAYVGNESRGTRNPIHYIESPFDLSECRCGCGEQTRADFMPGHDQRAIHDRVGNFGSVAGFLDWFDETYRHERAKGSKREQSIDASQ
jgi:hypothetical protein